MMAKSLSSMAHNCKLPSIGQVSPPLPGWNRKCVPSTRNPTKSKRRCFVPFTPKCMFLSQPRRKRASNR